MFLNSKGSRAFEIELPASDVPTGFWGVVFIEAFNVPPRMKGDSAASYSSNAAQPENIISDGAVRNQMPWHFARRREFFRRNANIKRGRTDGCRIKPAGTETIFD
jgi:hypothetical protein